MRLTVIAASFVRKGSDLDMIREVLGRREGASRGCAAAAAAKDPVLQAAVLLTVLYGAATCPGCKLRSFADQVLVTAASRHACVAGMLAAFFWQCLATAAAAAVAAPTLNINSSST